LGSPGESAAGLEHRCQCRLLERLLAPSAAALRRDFRAKHGDRSRRYLHRSVHPATHPAPWVQCLQPSIRRSTMSLPADSRAELLPGTPAAPPIDPIETLLVAVLRGSPLIILLALLGTGIGLIAGLMQPNVFESTGKVQVRQGTREAATPDSALDPDKPGS